MFLNIRGLKTRYEDTGGDLPVALLLHGWAAGIDVYRPVTEQLKKGYRVIAFDMPGAGQTEEPAEPYTLEDYRLFTIEFCEKLGIDEAMIFCHSNGCRIAAALMGDENCPVKCKKALFIDGAGIPDEHSTGFMVKQKVFKMAKSVATAPGLKKILEKPYNAARDRFSSEDYRNASPVMKQTLVNMLAADTTELLKKIRAQVLLVWGEYDTATPLAQGQRMEQLIPGSGLAVIRGSGHFPFIDNPAQFSAVLNAYFRFDK